jgi:subtilisin family serine protease
MGDGMREQPSAIRFRLANHIIGEPFDPPRWADHPRLRHKDGLSEGNGTAVAVLDSGISRHRWLRDSYSEPIGIGDFDAWDLSAGILPRHVGHGTFVSGVVLQYAPRTTLIPRRVVDVNGHANDDDLAAVIDSLRPLDPDVLNLSLVPEVEPGVPDEGTSKTLAAVRTLQDTCGTVVVTAAGNDGERFPTEHLAPADELTVVVGALDLSGRPAWFSNRNFVSIWAPGVDVLSTFVHWDGLLAPTPPTYESDTETAFADYEEAAAAATRPVAPFAGWARWNGTSFAAPAVAGAIAAEISRLSHVPDRKERRQAALCRVLDAARELDVDGEKSRALVAAPVVLQGPPRAEHDGRRR